MNTPSLQITFNESDSIYNYKLIVNSEFEICDFKFKKKDLPLFENIGMYPQYSSLFYILDFIYIPNEKKVLLLIHEWGEVKLFEFYYNPQDKEIGRIKDNGKLVFFYKIRKMDVDLICANSMCLKYSDDNLYLMLSIPYSKIRIIKIPFDNYQEPVKLIAEKSESFESEKFDPIIYVPSGNSDTINMILRDRIQHTSYSNTNFKFLFVLDDNKTEKTVDENKRTLYLNERYFFCTSNSKKIIVKYENLHWIFSEYKEIPIDPTVPINTSL